MTGADKVVCQAATLLLLFTLTSMPAKAQFAGFGGGGSGGEDMMTQMAPMLEMMKAKMGKRRFATMMQTMGPMMSRMMEGGGGGLGGMMAAAVGGRRHSRHGAWRLRRRRRHGHARRRWRRRADEHGPATDAHGQFRRRPSWPASPAAVVSRHCESEATTCPPSLRRRRSNPSPVLRNGLLRFARNDAYHDNAGRTAGLAASAPIGSASRWRRTARRATPSRPPPA